MVQVVWLFRMFLTPYPLLLSHTTRCPCQTEPNSNSIFSHKTLVLRALSPHHVLIGSLVFHAFPLELFFPFNQKHALSSVTVSSSCHRYEPPFPSLSCVHSMDPAGRHRRLARRAHVANHGLYDCRPHVLFLLCTGEGEEGREGGRAGRGKGGKGAADRVGGGVEGGNE